MFRTKCMVCVCMRGYIYVCDVLSQLPSGWFRILDLDSQAPRALWQVRLPVVVVMFKIQVRLAVVTLVRLVVVT
jgi:hypothetical protein